MSNSRIERFFYSGKTIKSSEFFVIMFIEVQLPPVPCLGMEVITNIGSVTLEEICWNPDKQCFICRAGPKFFWEYADGFTLDKSIAYLKKLGWSEAGRLENYEFEVELDEQNLDREKRFSREVEALSELNRIELRRRLDEASFLAAKIVRIRDALTTLEARQRSRSTMSQRIYHWGFGGAFLLSIVSWLNPDWITSRDLSTYVLSWAALTILYGEVIVPMMAMEVRSLQSAGKDAELHWQMATGLNWSNESYGASTELVGLTGTDYWGLVKDSVMQIVKKPHVLSRSNY